MNPADATGAGRPTVFVVDDDEPMREALEQYLESAGFTTLCFADGPTFLAAVDDGAAGCALLDVAMPGMSGHEVHSALKAREVGLTVMFLTGHGDVPGAVNAVRNGAVDFLEKPVRAQDLLEAVTKALEVDEVRRQARAYAEDVRHRYGRLSPREREIMVLVVDGLTNKEIARSLGLSPRTVEAHRTHVMNKMAADGLTDLVRMAACCRAAEPPPA
ncbi:MAG: response regulator [Gammaproteobacteria bacterium]|nr:response regulator [Gammaproteobacteria bacterium]